MQQKRKFRSFSRRRFTTGVPALQLPDHRRGQRNQRQAGEERDEVRTEPVEFLPLVENDLQRSQARRDEAETGPVHGEPSSLRLHLLHIGRIPEHDARQEHTDDADRNVDVEDPAPGVIISDPSSGRRPEHGRHQDCHGVKRHRHTAFLGGEAVGENRLNRGLQPSAGKSLRNPEQHEDAERRRKSTGGGEDREQQDGEKIVVFASENGRQPSADRKYNRIRDQVAGEHPSALIERSREPARDVRQGNIGNGRVEHFHKGADGYDDRDQPGVEWPSPAEFSRCRSSTRLRPVPARDLQLPACCFLRA